MRWRRLWNGLYDFLATTAWPRMMLFGTWLVLVVGSFLGLRAGAPSAPGPWVLRDASLPSDLLLTLMIALPNLMLFVLARILLFRISRRRFNLVEVSREGGRGPAIPAHAFVQAHTLWAYERERTQTRYMANLLPQIAVFGVLASMAVAGGILGLEGVFGPLDEVPIFIQVHFPDGPFVLLAAEVAVDSCEPVSALVQAPVDPVRRRVQFGAPEDIAEGIESVDDRDFPFVAVHFGEDQQAASRGGAEASGIPGGAARHEEERGEERAAEAHPSSSRGGAGV